MAKTTTLSEAKEFLRISTSSQDVVIQVLIDSAEEYVAKAANVVFKTDTELAAEIIEFNDGGEQYIFMNQRPVRSVSSLAPTNDAGNPLDPTEYALDGSCVRKSNNGDFAFGVNRWTVTYVGGYGDTDPATIYPPAAKLAVLQMVYKGYNNRGGKNSESGQGVSANWGNLIDDEIRALISSFSKNQGFF